MVPRTNLFPFVALVGQENLKDALLWSTIDPTIGGVLLTGTRGTAKSTAVRALADLLPMIDVIANDPFNRAPVDASGRMACVPTPFVELPVGATEDRVIGTLDVRSLLVDAERRFEPGLLARANRGILYVDEVNLLPDHLVDVLLDAAATGSNIVERDGASFVHDAQIVLVGTMNPEEGELRPQLLDRFGLCVAIAGDDDVDRRVEILERRLAFERDPQTFFRVHETESTAMRARIVRARSLLKTTTIDHACLRLAAELAIDARAEGMRADLAIVRTARAIAAFDERTNVLRGDVERAAIPALAHRRREVPRETPRPPSSRPPNPPRPGGPSSREQPANDATAGSNGDSIAQKTPTHNDGENHHEIGAPTHLRLPDDLRRDAFLGTKRRSIHRVSARGRSISSIPSGIARVTTKITPRISALATIHVASRERSSGNLGSRPIIVERHLRFIERLGRERRLVVFLVDASGSMAAAERMRAAKGVVGALLENAYHRRDAVALICFRGNEAEVLVPPTRSALVAYRCLRSLPTGGRTPLASGLRRANELITTHARRNPGMRAHLVLVSDARANAPAQGAFRAAVDEAEIMRAAGLRALCVDTEMGRLRLGNAERLSLALGATYRHLEHCTERELGATLREWMATTA